MRELNGEMMPRLEAQVAAMQDRTIAKANGFDDAVAILDRAIADLKSRIPAEKPRAQPKAWWWLWLRD